MLSNPAVTRRLLKEIKSLKNEPQEGIRITTSEENIFDVTGIVAGPAGTPYEGGFFRVHFTFTDEFPNSPPKCRMMTKIFHPNVSASGEICVNTLKKDWKPTFGIEHILITVRCLLIYPNPESALDEEAGRELLENYEGYSTRAKLITKIHATPKVAPIEFNIPSVPSRLTTTGSSKPSTQTSSSQISPPTSLKSSMIESENDPTPNSVAPSSKPRSKSIPAPLVPINPVPPLQPATHSAANAQLPSKTTNIVSTSNELASIPSPPAKAVKRAATSVATGAEKRKKALKRL